MPRLKVRHAFTALLLLVAMLFQGTWALAGTTGGITGNVHDTDGAPVANAKVTVSSPSEVMSATTDGSGHFSFLTLDPDSYVLSVSKAGYQDTSVAGVTVFADNVQTVSVTMPKALKTIASVHSQAASSLVKSGVGGDIYNVTPTQINKTSALGGGGNLDSAYSAVASVPGVTVPSGGAGWNQNVYIRGAQSFFSGFEYDGIPVNRAFDNYNTSTESNLGLQELQVYTGGGPASNSSTGTSGFINQVIKTGTYPGYGAIQLGIAAPAFYHSARAEAGGASPNRNFSYYVGIGGYNQDLRLFNNQNGADLFTPTGTLGGFPAWFTNVNLGHDNYRGVMPLCNADGSMPANILAAQPWWTADGAAPSCYIYNAAAALYGNYASVLDRENVVNFHFGIPRHNGLRDDIQLLWSSSAMDTPLYSSINDAGGYNAFMLAVTGMPYQAPSASNPGCLTNFYTGGNNYPCYIDATAYNLPFGTPIAGHTPNSYYQPSSPQNRAPFAQIPATARDAFRNDTGIVKLQWTHPLSQNAFARVFGYTFFSDWTQAGAVDSFGGYEWGIGGPTDYGAAANYDLITHTAGGEVQLTDQLNEKNLLQLTGNYTTATVSRFNNTGWLNEASPIGYISHNGGAYQCWDPSTGASSSCLPYSAYQSDAITGPTGTAPAGSPAAQAGAQWVSLWNGDTAGTYNTVVPKFSFLALSDDFRPSDKLDINASLRYEDYVYDMSAPTPGTDFYAQIVSSYVCQNSAGTVDTVPLKPGQSPPAKVNYQATCPAGYHHPAFSATSPASYTISDVSPRISLTYTESPNTVWRASVGRFTEPPISASVQYLNSSGNALSVWNATLPLGFNSPFHPIPAMSSTNADLSYEHQIRGTDMSFKLTPFLNLTQGYQEQSFIGPNFVTQAPVGEFRSYGAEAAFTKGDFSRNGLSGQLSLTYTNAKVQYQAKYYGANQISAADTAIAQFNTLTKGGGGAPCYTEYNTTTKTAGTPDSCSDPHAVLNPYYNMQQQSLLDPNGWYAPGNTGLSPTNNPTTSYFDSPWVGALILNYRANKFAITPSLQFMQGSSYGGPMDVVGYDPRACASNSVDSGITAVSPNTNPIQCDYLSSKANNLSPNPAAGQIFIPNPQTGFFAKPGQFRDPNIVLLNVQMSYDISPRVTAQLTLADLYHSCFGGSSEPWSKAYTPGQYVCGYGSNSGYISNYYNGTSMTDAAANGGYTPYQWQQQSYTPNYGSAGSSVPLPFAAYFQLQIKL